MEKWARSKYQPCLPLGDNNSRITGCKRHIQLSREAACEGIVLLKNERNVLPLKKGTKVALFGNGQFDYVKGGGGSGMVYCEYVRNIYEGLKSKDDIAIFEPLSLFYKKCVFEQYKNGASNGNLVESAIPKALLKEAALFTDTAIIVISRFSGEGYDRKNDGSDTYFELSNEERAMVENVSDNFEKIIVLLNTGAIIDASWFSKSDKISSALMIWQGGMEGGLAVADVLVGDTTPSGKLVDTYVRNFDDYPSSKGFHESKDFVKYTEDVFVGYRYFETIPNKKGCVIYPFGYGLSYTDFEIKNINANSLGDRIVVCADVKNIGNFYGKEVVQVYYSAPEGKITKPARELCAFAKTNLLAPGETETLTMSFAVEDMASYDDIGDVQKSAYVLECGEYKIYVGNNVRDAKEIGFKYIASQNVICRQLSECCVPSRLSKRLLASGEYVDVPEIKHTSKKFECNYICDYNPPKEDGLKKSFDCVAKGEILLDDFIAQLSDYELLSLLNGCPNLGVANTFGMGNLPKYGIPSFMTADGPAGVRISTKTGITTTAFPIETMLACTWNEELVEKVGVAAALEIKENNIAIWLAPALNIHRNPLCGRNFEYFSEDPYITGKMAAAVVRGVQSQNIVATPKHFACNNKETNRHNSDSIVSERALREIYLRGFEICVKESKPRLIMTSYNIINGVRASENAELLTGILRNEWGYDGLLTTDWWNSSYKGAEIIAGNDIRMPILEDGDNVEKLTEIINMAGRNRLAECVKRLLEMLLWLC